jgi:hypothetical protein
MVTLLLVLLCVAVVAYIANQAPEPIRLILWVLCAAVAIVVLLRLVGAA